MSTDCDVAPMPDEAIEKGLRYLGDHIKDLDSLSAWCDIGNVALAGGCRAVGRSEWCQLGTTMMLKQQRPDGSIVGSGPGEDDPVVATSFMLLFLSRDNDFVIMQKLQYKADDPPNGLVGSGNQLWNQRLYDSADLVKWLGLQMCGLPLVWQSVDISDSVEAFHDAPILYIAGSTQPKLTDSDKAKLRQYAEEGGLIVGNANCDKEAFKKWFADLGTELFPAYVFRKLPAQHPIYAHGFFEFPITKLQPGVSGISNGVRELMLLMDGDPAAVWQTGAKVARRPAFKIGSNIAIYAMDGMPNYHLRCRGETYYVRPIATTPATAH